MDPNHDKYLDIINDLQKTKVGETARIADIRKRLLANKAIYESDKNYLDELDEQSQRILFTRSKGATLLFATLPGFIGLLGIGHLYIGRTARGAGLLIAGIGILVTAYATAFLMPVNIILIAAFIIIFIWQIFNAGKLCKEYNNHLLETGEMLW